MIGVVERVRWWGLERVNRAGRVFQRGGVLDPAVVVEVYSVAGSESFPAVLTM